MFGSVAGNIHSKMSRPLTPNSFSSSKYPFEGHNIPSEVGTNQKLPITLKALSLDHNMLSILHAGVFSNLIQLSHLNVSHNLLNSLLEDIFKGLDSLYDLDLTYNFLTEFPKTIITLQVLRLANNKASLIYLKRYTPEDSRKDSLYALDLSHNRINIIPSDAFTNYTDMKMLNLAFNEITHIMTTPFPSKLRELKLHNNRLNTLPHDILDGFIKLLDLSLDNNRLVALPDFSSVKRFLESLSLSNKFILNLCGG